MTTFAEQQSRIAALLQESSVPPSVQGKYILQHQEELSRLARQKKFAQINWFQGVTGQALYTLPDNTVDICHVLYNQKVLRYVTERSLDYSGNTKSWEANTGEPTYWTTDNQGPNVFRVIPAPLRSGSTVPTLTLLPMAQDLRDNFCVFTYEDPAQEVTNVDSILPVLLDWEDILVFSTAGYLAQHEQPDQNLPLAHNCMKLVELWAQLMKKNGG